MRCLLRFSTRSVALEHIESSEHAELLRGVNQPQIAVISDQPTVSKVVIGLMARVMRMDPIQQRHRRYPEPGMGTTVMPTEQAFAEFIARRQQNTPIVMVNWLRFRAKARYEDPGEADISGQAAYYR